MKLSLVSYLTLLSLLLLWLPTLSKFLELQGMKCIDESCLNCDENGICSKCDETHTLDPATGRCYSSLRTASSTPTSSIQSSISGDSHALNSSPQNQQPQPTNEISQLKATQSTEGFISMDEFKGLLEDILQEFAVDNSSTLLM